MSADINFEKNKASPISAGSSGLENAASAGMKLLQFVSPRSSLGIGGFILPLALALMKNFRLIQFALELADRATNRPLPQRLEDMQ